MKYETKYIDGVEYNLSPYSGKWHKIFTMSGPEGVMDDTYTTSKRTQKRVRIFPSKEDKYTAFLESWVDHLDAYPHSTVAMYRLALAIQRAATLQNTLEPKLSNTSLSVHRTTKYRQLPRLAKLGMIKVLDTGRGRGRSTIVRILKSNKPEE